MLNRAKFLDAAADVDRAIKSLAAARAVMRAEIRAGLSAVADAKRARAPLPNNTGPDAFIGNEYAHVINNALVDAQLASIMADAGLADFLRALVETPGVGAVMPHLRDGLGVYWSERFRTSSLARYSE